MYHGQAWVPALKIYSNSTPSRQSHGLTYRPVIFGRKFFLEIASISCSKRSQPIYCFPAQRSWRAKNVHVVWSVHCVRLSKPSAAVIPWLQGCRNRKRRYNTCCCLVLPAQIHIRFESNTYRVTQKDVYPWKFQLWLWLKSYLFQITTTHYSVWPFTRVYGRPFTRVSTISVDF